MSGCKWVQNDFSSLLSCKLDDLRVDLRSPMPSTSADLPGPMGKHRHCGGSLGFLSKLSRVLSPIGRPGALAPWYRSFQTLDLNFAPAPELSPVVGER